MKTIRDDIAQAMEDLTPPGTMFVVAQTYYDSDEKGQLPVQQEIFGPFDSWTAAANWAANDFGVVYPLKNP